MRFWRDSQSKFRNELQIEHPWGEVIRDGVLPVVDIGDPEVRNGIVELEQVEYL